MTIIKRDNHMEQNINIETRILEAAAKVFLEKGYEGTNMSLIADAAGIGRPALYYYYRTKDKIFGAIFGNLVKSFIPKVLEIIRRDSPVEGRIEDIVNAYFDQLSRNPRLPLFIVKEISRDPRLFLKTAEEIHIESYFVSMFEAYEAEIKAGHINDVPAYSIVMNMIGGVLTPFLFSPLFDVLNESSCGADQGDKGLDALIALWKPFLIQNMKNLLVPKR